MKDCIVIWRLRATCPYCGDPVYPAMHHSTTCAQYLCRLHGCLTSVVFRYEEQPALDSADQFYQDMMV